MLDSRQQAKRRALFHGILVLIPVLFAGVLYLAYTGYTSFKLYRSIKPIQRGYVGNLFRADKALGFASVPNGRGVEKAPLGPDVPAGFDEHGFRIPVDGRANAAVQRPVLLFLGCSFTYGDLTPAETTYASLVGDMLGGTVLNAGLGSYGLSQMLILGRKLIPQFMPDYVIIQYADWLVDRAVTPFAPTYIGKLPAPYFSDKHGIDLQLPVFQPKVFDVPLDDYQGNETSVTEFIAFMWRVGFPLLLYDDYHTVRYHIERWFGWQPEPAADKDKVVQYVYDELFTIARRHGAKPVVVILGLDAKKVQVPAHAMPDGALLVDAHQAQRNKLAVVDHEHYARLYYHWRGQPPVMIDPHPNAQAHQTIAEAIVQAIRSMPAPE